MSTPPAAQRRVLVVGDVMLDISWLVEGPLRETSSQAHGGVAAQYLVAPEKHTRLIGGSATVARRLLAVCADMDVVLAGGCSDELSAEIASNAARFIPEQVGRGNSFRFVRIARTTFDTLKWRIYKREQGIVELSERFDRDLAGGFHTFTQIPSELKPTNFHAVIVTDFAKGLLDLKQIRDWLISFVHPLFLLRTKRYLGDSAEVLKKLPWTLLLPNRDDVARMVADHPIGPRAFQRVGNQILVHPRLIHILRVLRAGSPQHLQGAILVKLDQEGSLLLAADDSVTPIVLTPKDRGDFVGVSAGDVFIADLVDQLTKVGPTPVSIDNLREACGRATASATAYCRTAEVVVHKDCYGRLFDKKPGVDTPVPLIGDAGQLQTLYDQTEHGRCSDVAKVSKICVPFASWFLDGFLTVNEEFGSEIESLRQNISLYLDEPDYNRKPFVTALCGPPGSGKSTLARRLAAAARCPFVEENAAQWVAAEDLFWACERIRTLQLEHPEAVPFVFLDEIDTRIDGEPLYAKLLAPLWDRCYHLRGDKRAFGPTIFVLAGSDPAWQEKDKLLSARDSRRSPKLTDLVSRFTVSPIEIPKLDRRRADLLYLVAQHLTRRYSNVRDIGKHVFAVFLELQPKHGSRSVTRALDQLRFRDTAGKISLAIDRHNKAVFDLNFYAGGSEASKVVDNWQSLGDIEVIV